MSTLPAFGFDLGLAKVLGYASLTVVVFRCGCRWVSQSEDDFSPVTVPCEEHRPGAGRG